MLGGKGSVISTAAATFCRPFMVVALVLLNSLARRLESWSFDSATTVLPAGMAATVFATVLCRPAALRPVTAPRIANSSGLVITASKAFGVSRSVP